MDNDQLPLSLDFDASSTLVEAAMPTLPVWSEGIRGFPISMAVSSLFSTNVTGERKNYKKLSPVYSEQSFDVYFKGEELRSVGDQEVWMQLMHLARGRTFNGKDPVDVTFTARQFLQELDWATSGENYQRLSDSLDRLQGAQIKIVARSKGRRTGVRVMSFISNYEAITPRAKVPNKVSSVTKWKIRLDQYAANVYGEGMIQIEVSKDFVKLPPSSKKIYEILLASGQEETFSIQLSELHELLTNGKETEYYSTKQNIKKSLEKLRTNGFIHHFSFDKEDVLYVTRNAAAAETLQKTGKPTVRIHKSKDRDHDLDS